MLLEAVAIDDPVHFLRAQVSLLPPQGGAAARPSHCPLGKARIARQGRDLTIVAYSAMVHEALAAAEELVADG